MCRKPAPSTSSIDTPLMIASDGYDPFEEYPALPFRSRSPQRRGSTVFRNYAITKMTQAQSLALISPRLPTTLRFGNATTLPKATSQHSSAPLAVIPARFGDRLGTHRFNERSTNLKTGHCVHNQNGKTYTPGQWESRRDGGNLPRAPTQAQRH